jgi:ubiquinone/menaquinone biosynthesis C-methylase UbiE
MDERTRDQRWWQNWDDRDKRERVEAFWRHCPDQIAERKQWYKLLGEAVRNTFGTTVPIRVLDFGCGTGEDQPFISDLCKTYYGVDVTPEMLQVAKTKHPGIAVDYDDILASRFGDRAWPLVICNAVLPHLPLEMIPQAISELWRITQRLLVVRVFGVGRAGDECEKKTLDGFLYNWLPASKWTELLTVEGATLTASLSTTPPTQGSMVLCLSRTS